MTNRQALRLKGARKLANLTQAQLGEKLRVSQKQISQWERGEAPVPEKAQTWSKSVLDKSPDLPVESFSENVSSAYSYDPKTFEALRRESKIWAKSVSAEAILQPSKEPGFADAELRIVFEGMRVPRNESFIMDCLGIPAQPEEGKLGSELSLIE